MGRVSKIVIVGIGTVLFVFVGGGSVLTATSGDSPPGGSEAPVSRDDLTDAERAALDATGGTHVTESEVGDEDSFYEIEVAFDDGRRIEVQLDESFAVVGTPTDAEISDLG